MQDFQEKFFRLLTLIYQGELQITKELDIPLLEYYALQVLSSSPVVTPKEIADRLSLPKSSVTNIVDSLERKGLVRRELNKRDRRSWLLVLTDKGKETIRMVFAQKSQLMMPAFGGMSENEKSYWSQMIDNLIESFERRNHFKEER